jgi:hypothetical protein
MGVVAGGFDRSRAVFEAMVSELAGADSATVTHDDLEQRLETSGRELMRQLFQDHADLRALREQRTEKVVGVDAVVRTRVERGRSRQLATVFGPVTVTRMAYRSPGTPNLFPADEQWSLPAGLHSHGVGRLVAIEATRGSFESAQAAIERATGVRVGKRQVEDLTVAAAADIELFYRVRRPAAAAAGTLLVLSCDGKGVVMRPDALRPATAKAAAAATGKLATRVSPGEKPHRKRMAEIACVYDAERAPRTPADVMAGTAARNPGPKAAGKWVTGSLTCDTADVIIAAFDEAERRDPHHRRPWIALVDGNRHQIDVIETEAARRGIRVRIVADLIHVIEYVWGAAWSFFDKADPAAEAWVAEQLTKILDGKATRVASGIRRRATLFGYKHSERAGADRCADYLTSLAGYLRYDLALTHGWPIATGVIEGACRHLVADRLDITGARWGLAGAEAVLRLRAVISNGDFDDYWRFHVHREHERNHENHYQQTQSDYQLVG